MGGDAGTPWKSERVRVSDEREVYFRTRVPALKLLNAHIHLLNEQWRIGGAWLSGRKWSLGSR